MYRDTNLKQAYDGEWLYFKIDDSLADRKIWENDVLLSTTETEKDK